MSDPILQLLTRAVFIVVCALTIWDVFRWRDIQHLEVAALFAGLTLVIATQAVGDVLHVTVPRWLATASTVALLAQPYLLLRVLAQFHEVPRPQLIIALTGFVLSGALFIVYAG